MALLKDGKVSEDPFHRVGDAEPVPDTGAVIVPLATWTADRERLRARTDPIGVLVRAGEGTDDVLPDTDRLDVIVLEFPTFKDGRAYSYARVIRERGSFKGELRATGDVLPDQLGFMQRCGFDSFEVEGDAAAAAWSRAVSEIGVWYQPTGDGRQTAMERRRAASGRG